MKNPEPESTVTTSPELQPTETMTMTPDNTKIAFAHAAYQSSIASLKNLDAEAKALRDRQSMFSAEAAKTADALPILNASLIEKLCDVGLGSADFCDVESIQQQISATTSKADNFRTILNSIDAAVSAKDTERRDARDMLLSCRSSFLTSICEELIDEMRPSLRLLLHAYLSEKGSYAAQGRGVDFEPLLKAMLNTADLTNLSDQRSILTERFGFTD